MDKINQIGKTGRCYLTILSGESCSSCLFFRERGDSSLCDRFGRGDNGIAGHGVEVNKQLRRRAAGRDLPREA